MPLFIIKYKENYYILPLFKVKQISFFGLFLCLFVDMEEVLHL